MDPHKSCSTSPPETYTNIETATTIETLFDPKKYKDLRQYFDNNCSKVEGKASTVGRS